MALLRSWLGKVGSPLDPERPIDVSSCPKRKTVFCKRIIACLDVRTDDHGNLVVTKGDQVIHLKSRRPHCGTSEAAHEMPAPHHLFSPQYDVRESTTPEGDSEMDKDGRSGKVRRVRNLGKPVDLSAR